MQNNKLWRDGLVAVFLILVGWLAYTTASSNRLFKPNIVLILADDLDLTLMPYMPNVDKLITQQGASFTNYFVTTPLCCPSRASMLRGQYSHNTNILENSPGFINFFRNTRETETIATWLNRANYKTSLIGKYLNGYPVNAGKRYVPPGWTDWHVFMNQFDSEIGAHYYYDYELNENGELVYYGTAPEEYSTDVFRDKSIQFINASVDSGSPFFLLLAVKPPHGPSIGAPRHLELYQDLEYPLKPSFQETDLSDKPASTIALARSGDEFDVYDANALFRKRVQSLQALDELVAKVVQVLEDNGQLDNTYIIFTSDNGYHMGEHGLPGGKDYPYEEDIHVPFIVRGPGIQPNIKVDAMSANIDIAPTLTELAGVKSAEFIDGRSLMPFLHPQSSGTLTWREALLIETGYESNETDLLVYRGVRTGTFIYLEYKNGDLEYYDLINDPYQLNNIAAELDTSMLESLHAWLEQLKTCRAAECRAAETAMPDDLKISP